MFRVCIIWNIKPSLDEKEGCLLRIGLGDQGLEATIE